MIWSSLIHLSTNMWIDREAPEWDADHTAKPYLRFDMDLWRELVPKMVEAGINMVVLDLGDGIKYQSHPEIAVEGAWTTDQLKDELAKLRAVGIEPIPKLNFSACHDVWMGPYSRMLSTDTYYVVCKDIIAEIIGLFDKPRFFHLGMDEETYPHQQHFEYVVVRQFDLWWHDLLFLVEQVEKGGSRAWIWSDYLWHYPEVFWARMPKSVLQSNWYYGESFSTDIGYVKAYLDLEGHGYELVVRHQLRRHGEVCPRAHRPRSPERLPPNHLASDNRQVARDAPPSHRASGRGEEGVRGISGLSSCASRLGSASAESFHARWKLWAGVELLPNAGCRRSHHHQWHG